MSGADLWAIIEALQKVGKEGAAEDFRSRARAFFTWCVKSKALDANPLLGYRKERSTRADRISKQEHGRALSDVELAKVWQAASLGAPFGRLIRFLILTGCRRGEGAGLTWPMVDRADGVINLPAAFVKQGRGHSVPIAPALADLLDVCPISAGSDLVFPSVRSGGLMSGWSDLTGALSKTAGVDFKLHDLRRTFRTGLSRLGVNSDLAELAMGHARVGLEATYNRDAGLAALRVAFELWSAHVEQIVSKSLSSE
ncbi:site-specific integrase [Methylocella tundrae]|uniref:site-specific integrase n=1 Tax=Methylocella tundrae TaxID=227605 RepID=UPI0030FE7709|nr:site-specific integrase [Methylocella tundrae]